MIFVCIETVESFLMLFKLYTVTYLYLTKYNPVQEEYYLGAVKVVAIKRRFQALVSSVVSDLSLENDWKIIILWLVSNNACVVSNDACVV